MSPANKGIIRNNPMYVITPTIKIAICPGSNSRLKIAVINFLIILIYFLKLKLSYNAIIETTNIFTILSRIDPRTQLFLQYPL